MDHVDLIFDYDSFIEKLESAGKTLGLALSDVMDYQITQDESWMGTEEAILLENAQDILNEIALQVSKLSKLLRSAGRL